jgi:hypothetical protein
MIAGLNVSLIETGRPHRSDYSPQQFPVECAAKRLDKGQRVSKPRTPDRLYSSYDPKNFSPPKIGGSQAVPNQP